MPMLSTLHNNYTESAYVFKAASQSSSEVKPITICTTQKTGTHFLFLVFEHLSIPIAEHKWPGHWMVSYVKRGASEKEIKHLFKNNNRYLILYRDPRDWLVSMINWMSSQKHYEYTKPLKTKEWMDSLRRWKQLSFNEKLNYAMNPKPKQVSQFIPPYIFDPRHDCMDKVITLMRFNLPNVLFVKFEDIIGEEYGGAEKSKQIEAIQKIAKFSNLNVSDEQVQEAIKNSQGQDTLTLSSVKKKVGQWKTEFSPRHVKMFKQKYNKYLLFFGYESDPNWDLNYREK